MSVAHQMLAPISSLIITRTTLDIDSSVLAQLRRQADAERKSMGQVASERLALALGGEAQAQPPPLSWPSRHMGKPKVDLGDKEAVRRALEGTDGRGG